jgi:hypothetical protein
MTYRIHGGSHYYLSHGLDLFVGQGFGWFRMIRPFLLPFRPGQLSLF